MLYSLLTAALCSVVLGRTGPVTPQAKSDQITSLPGQPSGVTFNQYSGYILIDQPNNKSIFYYFQESDSTAANVPVFFWTNGGPGCSGLLGAFIEQGAFRIQENGTLLMNPGRWNQQAHMLFVEQPAGVGFSYSNPKNYITGDTQAVEDMYAFIQGWFAVYPNYKSNEFYISSESYGGHYMPQLAKYIVTHNQGNAINFKGFLVGNPYTDPVENTKGTYDTFFGHSLVSLPAWKKYYTVCNDGQYYDQSDCQAQMQILDNQVGNIYLYGLDWPVCNDGQSLYGFKQQQWFIEKVWNSLGRGHVFTENKRRALAEGDDQMGDLYQPCATDYLTTYLNRQDVQTALHVAPGIQWSMCAELAWNASDYDLYMEPYYQFLINGGYNLHITVYSGDDDSVCGTLGTQSWLWNLGYSKMSSWTAWTQDEADNGPQVAGYHIQFGYQNKVALSFVTVHSAGHQVPWYNALRGYEILNGYLDGRW